MTFLAKKILFCNTCSKSLTSFRCFYSPFSSVSIVDFEQVNVGWIQQLLNEFKIVYVIDNTVFSTDTRICKFHSQLKLKFHCNIFISWFRNFVIYKMVHFYTQKQPSERCSVRKGVLRYFAKLKGKHLCKSLFFNKVTGLPEFYNFVKKKLWHRCLSVNFVKFLRTTFSQNTSGRLLQ